MIQEFIRSQPFLLTLTIGLYFFGLALYRRTRIALLHPVLTTVLIVIVFLRTTSIEYEHYAQATSIIDFMLGLSVVAIGYLLYEQIEQLRAHAASIVASTVAGSFTGIVSAVAIAYAMGADRAVIASLAPKSITTPIAIAVAAPLGGIASLTSVVVICVGIFGSLIAPALLDKMGVTDRIARGLALGSAAHGIGTARAVEIGAVEGALSGLAMGLMGLFTAILVPLLARMVM